MALIFSLLELLPYSSYYSLLIATNDTIAFLIILRCLAKGMAASQIFLVNFQYASFLKGFPLLEVACKTALIIPFHQFALLCAFQYQMETSYISINSPTFIPLSI